MRKHYPITSLITVITLLLSGCHQTSATTGAPSLSPVGAGQAPTLNPFGGQTKVSPPPTGSYSSPNSYMGTPVPAGAVAPGQISPMPNGPYPVQSNNAVGSGVQPGGWTSSNPSVATVAPNNSGFASSGVAPVSTFGVESANDPRAGGMQVIDLTGAPPPPGYRPENSSMNISVPPPQTPPGGWGGQPNPSVQAPSYPTPSYPTPTYPTATSPAPTSPAPTYPAPTYQAPNSPPPTYPASAYPNTNMQNVSSPYPTNPSAEIASRLTPLPPTNNAIPMNQPTVQSAGTQSFGPSTEPITPNNSGDPSLMWRTPGSQF